MTSTVQVPPLFREQLEWIWGRTVFYAVYRGEGSRIDFGLESPYLKKRSQIKNFSYYRMNFFKIKCTDDFFNLIRTSVLRNITYIIKIGQKEIFQKYHENKPMFIYVVFGSNS